MLRCSRATASHSSDSFNTCVLLIKGSHIVILSRTGALPREFKRSFGAKITINSKCVIQYACDARQTPSYDILLKKKVSCFGFIHCRVVVKTSSFVSKGRVRVKNESKWVHDKTKMNDNMVLDSVLITTRRMYYILNQLTPPLCYCCYFRQKVSCFHQG